MGCDMEQPTIMVHTGATTGAVRMENSTPTSYRLAQYPDGSLVLQGAFQWHQGSQYGHEWRDIPTHIIDHSSDAV